MNKIVSKRDYVNNFYLLMFIIFSFLIKGVIIYLRNSRRNENEKINQKKENKNY